MKTNFRPSHQDFTLQAALKNTDQASFARWLDAYLRGPGNNIPLAEGLQKAERWWIIPQEIELSRLVPQCGPNLKFHEEPAGWKSRCEKMASAIRQGWQPLPLIAEFKDGSLLLADGNHSHEALRLTGVTKYWAAIWFNSEADLLSFTQMAASKD